MTILLVCQPCGKTAAIEGVDVLRHSVEFMRAAEVAGWTVVTDYRRSCVAAFCCEAHAWLAWRKDRSGLRRDLGRRRAKAA